MRFHTGVLLGALITFLVGCQSAPRKGGYYLDDGPPTQLSTNPESIPDATPKFEPLHRPAMRPYTALGMQYTPMTRLEPYRARGRASWYGTRYHGRLTAIGERYDMLGMSAAHPTLPLPCYVKITHLENRRSVVVRVNDRGPFRRERLIDLSYAAAAKLDFAREGSADVEVELILPDGQLAYLQLGAFQQHDNARALVATLRDQLGTVADTLRVDYHLGLHRVVLGPYSSAEEAWAMADRIRTLPGIEPAIQPILAKPPIP